MDNAIDSKGRRPSDVEYFVVCRDTKKDNATVYGEWLSSLFSTMDKALAAYPAIKAKHSDAGIGGGVRFFNPRNPESMAEREAFIKKLDAGVRHG